MPVLQNIAQLATCPAENPQSDAGLVSRAAVVWSGETIRWVGPQSDLPDRFRDEPTIDGEGGLVIPGLVDCHTHLCFGGWRAGEFEQRLGGATYQEIAAAGGGIARTVSETRAATANALERKACRVLESMLELGVTSVECKSGYGLEEASELKQLRVYDRLNHCQPIDLYPTFLGAHIVPTEFADQREDYITLLCRDLIPKVAEERLATFCDVFVEDGAFSVDEARGLLLAARSHGLGLKVHADQFSAGGGALLAAELGAVSAEHLEYVSEEGVAALAASGTVAVSLPLASLYLGEPYLRAREMIDKGVRVAVATDFNPGSAPSYHLPLAMTVACLNQRMAPQEALMGVTIVAARALNAHDRIGSLLPGYRADLALLAVPSLNHWLYQFQPNACVATLKDGQWVYRSRRKAAGLPFPHLGFS